jgi:anaerobic selenocysteine-containing dehydrogenase
MGISLEEADAMQLAITVELLKAAGNTLLEDKSLEQIVQHVGGEPGQDRLFDVLLRAGPYGDHFGGRPDGLTLERLKAHPHGVDYGGMQPRLPDNLATPDRKIDLAPELLMDDLARLEAELDRNEEGDELVLIGRRHVRSNNSWMHNLPVLMKGKDRAALLIHPKDARARGIGEGDPVEIEAANGTLQVRAELCEDLRQGVVSLPHGFGHTEPGTRMALAEAHPGVNLNRLAAGDRIDVPSWNAAYNGLPVTVRRAP